MREKVPQGFGFVDHQDFSLMEKIRKDIQKGGTKMEKISKYFRCKQRVLGRENRRNSMEFFNQGSFDKSFFKQSKMNLQDFIKIEHQSPIDSTSKQLNYYMTHFYDGDSQPQVKYELEHYEIVSLTEILERLEESVELRTTGIDQIMSLAREDPMICQQIDWELLKKKIMRRKIALKRDHAKKREKLQESKKDYYIICNGDVSKDERVQLQAEIKKKRNRISAQISRDRRKVKIQELQSCNSQLRTQTEKIKVQNEKLKKQLQDFNRFEDSKLETTKPKNSKFFSLLITLGILFLLSLFKTNPKPKTQEQSFSNKLYHGRSALNKSSDEQQLISRSQKTLADIESSEPLLGNKKSLNSIIEHLEKLKLDARDVHLPRPLKKQLDSVPGQLF